VEVEKVFSILMFAFDTLQISIFTGYWDMS